MDKAKVSCSSQGNIKTKTGCCKTQHPVRSLGLVQVRLRKGNNILRLGAFLALDNVKFYTLSFIQIAVAFTDDGVEMDKNITASITFDETVTLRTIEPFDGTLFSSGHDLELLSQILLNNAGFQIKRWVFYFRTFISASAGLYHVLQDTVKWRFLLFSALN